MSTIIAPSGSTMPFREQRRWALNHRGGQYYMHGFRDALFTLRARTVGRLHPARRTNPERRTPERLERGLSVPGFARDDELTTRTSFNTIRRTTARLLGSPTFSGCPSLTGASMLYERDLSTASHHPTATSAKSTHALRVDPHRPPFARCCHRRLVNPRFTFPNSTRHVW